MNGAMSNLLWLLVAGQSPAIPAPPPPPDLEVVGRLRNLRWEHVDDPEDLLGHGWATAEFRISRVLRGRAPSRLITIRYFGHTYLTDRHPIRLRLRANGNGIYLVCARPGREGVVCR